MVPVLLPLIAFALPVMVIVRNEKRPVGRPWLFSLGSFAAALGGSFTAGRRTGTSPVYWTPPGRCWS